MAQTSPSPSVVLRGHEAPVTTVAFSRDSKLLAAGDARGMLRFWDVQLHRTIASTKTDEEFGVLHAFTTANRDQWGIQNRNGKLCMWNLDSSGSLVKLNEIHLKSMSFCRCAEVQQLGVIVVPFDESNRIGLYDSRADSLIPLGFNENFDVKRGMVTSIAVRSNDLCEQIVVGFESGHLSIFNLRTQTEEEMHRIYKEPVLSIGCSLKDRIWTCGPECSIKCQSVKDNDCSLISEFPVEEGYGVNHITVRPDNKIVAASCWDSMVRIYACSNPRPLASLQLHTKSVQCCAFSFDSQLLASAGEDHRIAFWKIYT